MNNDVRCAHGCCYCCSEEEAFRNSVESITGPITRIISREGMPAVYEALDAAGKKEFEKVLSWNLQLISNMCFAHHIKLAAAVRPFVN